MTNLRERFARQSVSPGLLRAAAVIVTIIGASIALIFGQLDPVDPPEPGDPAPETYTADRTITVIDEEATEALRVAAANAVATVYATDSDVPVQAQQNIEAFFEAVTLEAYHDQVAPVEEVPEETTTTTTAATQTTVFADEGGEATIPLPDLVGSTESQARIDLAELRINLFIGDPVELPVGSNQDGRIVAQDPAADVLVTEGSIVTVQLGFVPPPPTTTTTTTTLPIPTLEEQELALEEAYAFLSGDTRRTFISIAQHDLDQVAAGESGELLLDVLLDDTVRLVQTQYAGDGIRTEELPQVLSAIANGSVILSSRDWPDGRRRQTRLRSSSSST